MDYDKNNIKNISDPNQYYYNINNKSILEYNLNYMEQSQSNYEPIYDVFHPQDDSFNPFKQDNEDFFLSGGDSFVSDNSMDNLKTGFQTKITEKNKIFNIKKIPKNIGRRTVKKPKSNLQPIKHGKNAEDNILTKVKIYFIKSSMLYINNKYKEYLKSIITKKMNKKSSRFLQKIKPTIAKAFRKDNNKDFLNLTMREIFSMDTSERCTTFTRDHNRKQIKKLYEENKAIEVIKILNKAMEEMYLDYISNNIDGFKFEDDVKLIAKQYENKDDNYSEKFKSVGMNLIKIINRNGRNNKKKIKNFSNIVINNNDFI